MQKFIETTGDTRDAAIEAALRQLGMDRDDVSVEVLDNGKKGFLGIGATPARVRVTYEVPDEPVKKEEPVHKPVEKPNPEKKNAEKPEKKENPRRSRKNRRKSHRNCPLRMKTTPRAWSRPPRRTLCRKSWRSSARPARSVRAGSAAAAGTAVRVRNAR